MAPKEFVAIDPAKRLFDCKCGKPECEVRRFRPLRDHIAALFRAVVCCGMEELLPSYHRADDHWPGVTYSLTMAASIEDVFADPSFVHDSSASQYCGIAWDRDEEDRESASKYIAALTIFNFVWLAYEAAIEEVADGRFSSDRTPVRGRKIFQAEAGKIECASFSSLPFRAARHYCQGIEKLEADIAKIDAVYELEGAAAAAELGRLFRNYVVHGDDPMPLYGELDPRPYARFYSMTSMLLQLIQALLLISLTSGNRMVAMSASNERLGRRVRAAWLIANLHQHEGLWVGHDPEAADAEPAIYADDWSPDIASAP